jgi:hypothetical protein
MNENLVKQLEEFSNKFATKVSTHEVNMIDRFLTENIKLQNFEIFNYLLSNSSYQSSRFYAANSLLQLLTQNYLTIPCEVVIQLHNYLLEFIVSCINLA